ncbi:hypothetical protein [Modestobacter sp. NPDC049651]|uniref:hypothetical protein n=1 Tax=unclassified Modestobacter TaxID=2643866 RepID=UPI0033DA68F7
MPARNQPTTRSEARRPRGGDRPAAAPVATDRLVLGDVPVLARGSGLALLLAALVGAAAFFPTYLTVGGVEVSQVTGPLDAVVALVGPVVTAVVAAGLLAGRVPRLGLAYAAVSGTLAVGRLLIELYQGRTSTDRPAVEVLAGERVVTSSVDAGPGWVLGLVALGLTVLAGLLALAAWERTVMEDGGTLDPVRPVLAGAAVLLGVLAVLCLALPAADVPDRVVLDPSTGLETVVAAEGPQALLERPGTALLGGLLLAGGLLLCAVTAPSLRPRLGAVGGLLALTAFLAATALSGLRDAAHSAELRWTLPGVGLVVCAVLAAGLTGLAWRWRAGRPPVPSGRGE